MKASYTKTYTIWQNMKARCNNPAHPHAKYYSEKGVTHDPRWANFAAFLVDMKECPTGMELDRIDNAGNYSKENCRWVSHLTNIRNNGRTKLTVEKVRIIKGLLRAIKTGTTPIKAHVLIGNLFGVNYPVIYNIANGLSWKEVT